MKLRLLFAFFVASFFAASAQIPDFSIYGYATLNGGTTGGAAGETVTPTTYAELVQYIEDPSTPYIIQITKEFNTGVSTYVDVDGTIVESSASGAIATTFGDILKIGSNKTLIGIGDQAFFNRIGLVIQCQSNIIIRNIKFTMSFVPATKAGEYKIFDTDGVTTLGDPDCIAMQADDDNLPEAQRITRNIWIDHCEFYNEDPNVMTEVDRYDGLVDMKNDVQYVTISWCNFHDHHKACLNGKGSSDDYDRKTTMHHNRFSNILSRMPLQRFGKMHMLNNYLIDNPDGNGLNVRINSNAYVEKNYFDNVKKPIFGKPSEGGKAHLVDNVFKDCGRLSSALMPCTTSPNADVLSDSEEYVDSDYVPEYLNSGSTVITAVVDVPTVVATYCGVGKLDQDVTTYTLSTSVTGGNGSIALSPAGGVYTEGTVVTVTATGNLGYAIGSWGGDLSGSAVSTTVTMDGDKSITASFTSVPTYTLTANQLTISNGNTGEGTITITPQASAYSAGTVVTVTATPNSQSLFSGWSGDLTSSSATIAITMDANKTVYAAFEEDESLVGKSLIAYVTDPAGAGYANDTKILPALKANTDFIVTEIDGTQSGNDYSAYDMVLISEVPGSESTGITELEGINKPLLMMKVHAYKSAVWNWATSGYDQHATATALIVTDNTHAIFNGITYSSGSDVEVLSAVESSKGLTYMDPSSFSSVSGGSIISLANISGASSQVSIFEIPVGVSVGGNTLTEKFVQIGINASSYANVTENGVKMVVNACNYLMDNTTEVKAPVVEDTFKCYPTMVKSATSLYVSSTSIDELKITVMSSTGQLIRFEEEQIVPGMNKVEVDMQACSKGVYLIVAESGAIVNTFKVIKE